MEKPNIEQNQKIMTWRQVRFFWKLLGSKSFNDEERESIWNNVVENGFDLKYVSLAIEKLVSITAVRPEVPSRTSALKEIKIEA